VYEGSKLYAPEVKAGDTVTFIYRRYLNNNSGGWSVLSERGTSKEALIIDEKGLTIHGNGTFSGTITAHEGNIAGWMIADKGLRDEGGTS